MNNEIILKNYSLDELLEENIDTPINMVLEHFTKYNTNNVFIFNGEFSLVSGNSLDKKSFSIVYNNSIIPYQNIEFVEFKDSIVEKFNIKILKIDKIKNNENKYCPMENINSDELQFPFKTLILRLIILIKACNTVKKHLSSRTSNGQTTIQHQLVKGEFADIITRLNMIISFCSDELISEDYKKTFIKRIHTEIDKANDNVHRLAGGHGYIIGGIGDYLYLSEVIKNIYMES